MKEKKYSSLILPGILLTALIFRLWGITNPLADFHHWRQAYTAMFAKHFYLENMNILYPRTDILNYENVTEFQLYPYIVAVLYKIFGYHDFLGRVVSAFFAVLSTYMLYLLSRRYFNERTGLLSAALFAVMPMIVFYTKTFMPESMMIFLSITMMYMVTRWLDTERTYYLVLAIIFTAMTLLVKIPTVYMGFPVLFLLFNKYGIRAFRQLQIYIYGLLSVLPPAYWYFIHPRISAANTNYNNPDINVGNLYFTPEAIKVYIYQLSSIVTWQDLFIKRIIEFHLTYFGFIFLVVYLVYRFYKKETKFEFLEKKSEQNMFLYWILGTVFFFLVLITPNLIHEYYQIPIIPAAIPLIAAGFFMAYEKSLKSGNKYLNWFVVLLLFSIIPFSVLKLRDRNRVDNFYIKIGEIVKKQTQPEDLIAILDDPRPEVFYFAERQGFYLFSPKPVLLLVPEETDRVINELNKMITDKKIKLFVISNDEFPIYGSKFKEYLDKNFTDIMQDPSRPLDLELAGKLFIYDTGSPKKIK